MLVALLAGCRSFETEPSEWRALEAFVEPAIVEWDVPGASIAVVHDGKVYTAGFGVRSLETQEPVTPDTQFRAASVTKMHTAMALLTLVEDGLLDLSAPVTDQIPGFALARPYQASSMTLHQLLTHSSGIQASGHVKDCEDIDPADLEPWVLSDGATWVQWTPPDVLYSYSNIGFAIAGLAAQDVTGELYADLMQERVIEPLGMTRSTFDVREASENHAIGHNIDPMTHEVAGLYGLEARGCATEWPYGGLITTAPDLARTVQALLSRGEPVMDASTYADWVTGGWEHSASSRYAYGISSSDNYLGHRMLTHGGAMEGYLSLVAAAPDDDWGIAILVNSDHATTWPTEPFSTPTLRIFLEAMSIYLGTPNDPVEPTVRPPEEWSIFTGDYYEQFTYGDLSVRQEGEELWMQIADPDPRDVQLMPYSSNTFKYERSYETIYQSSISFSLTDDGTGVDWVFLGDGIASQAPGPLEAFASD
jgi:CubicO group peptidase (beta-lactamase class C family)